MCMACKFLDRAQSSGHKQTLTEARAEAMKVALAMDRLRRPLIAPKKAPTFYLYRGDDRPPEQIKRDGFDWWPQGHDTVEKAGNIASYIAVMCNLCQHGHGVAAFVHVESKPERPTVSCTTKSNEAFSRQFIYAIQASGLTEYNLDQGIMQGINPKLGEDWKSNGLTVYMDTDSLSNAKIILMDIKLSTLEYDFFTKVDPGKITHHKRGGGKAWGPMSKVVAWKQGQTKA